MLEGTNQNGFFMPVSPAYGNGGAFGGDSWAWIILLLLLAGGNGYGNGFGGFGGGYDFPWILNGQQGINTNTNNGFQNAMINDGITSVRDNLADISTQLCGGFAGVTAAVNGAQNAVAQQLYTGQIADLERSFAAQTAQTAGMNNIAMNLQNCCCENRAATADLKYTVATEACADRSAVSEALRDVLAANTASTQRILDQMCQDKIDAKNEKITELQNKLTMAELRANNNAQTQTLLADNLAQTAALEQYLAPVPRPSYIVQNPNCCAQNTCGCGM